jgi:hypothetical protein
MARAVKKKPWAGVALLLGLGFAWSKLGLGAAVKDITPPPPSCPVGQAPKWFFGTQIINGQSVGPGWVCRPVDIKRL